MSRQEAKLGCGKTNSLWGCWSISAFCVVALAWTSSMPAQENYKTIEPQVTDAEGRSLLSTVTQVWNNPGDFQNAQLRQDFDRYFKEYLFPSMTRTTASGLAELGTNRNRLLRQLLWNPQYEQIHQHLTSITFDAMQRIAADSYHPAARYNAMLIIGWLDEKPGDVRGGSGQAPVPLPQAADFMLQALQADSAVAPDAVKLGALIGLERHARYGLPEDKRKAVADELVQLVVSSRPGDRTVEGHAWLQFKAAQALAQFGELGENNRVHDALVQLMGNDSVPVVERTYVAKSLEKLANKYTPQAGIDTGATIAALGNVLADVIEEEDKEAFKFNEEQRLGGGFQEFFFDEEPPGYPRGRLLQRINYVLDGFTAVQGAIDDDLKKEVEAVLAPVREIRALAIDRNSIDLALTKKIEETADRIKTAAGSLGQAEEASTPDATNDLLRIGN